MGPNAKECEREETDAGAGDEVTHSTPAIYKYMKKIKTVDAVGYVLQHDITQILPGEFKGRAFKKGHIIKEEDIPKLLSLGKDHIYVFELGEVGVHENDAARSLSHPKSIILIFIHFKIF